MRAFLKCKDIKGPVAEKPYVGWIELGSFSWGGDHVATVPSTLGSGESAHRSTGASLLSVTFETGIHTPPLCSALAEGRLISEVTLQVASAGRKRRQYKTFATWTMTLVVILSYGTAPAGSRKKAKKKGSKMDTCTLSYDKIEVKFA